MPNIDNSVNFILRNIPNKKRMDVLMQMVSFDKVLAAVRWLKEHNPHYKNVKIHTDKAQFMSDLKNRFFTIHRDKNVELSDSEEEVSETIH